MNRISCITKAQSATQEALYKVQDQLVTNELQYKTFKVGSKVWLKGTNLKHLEGTPKLSPRQYGPFRVAAQISHVTYHLNRPKIWQIYNIFHTSLLTPYHETPEHGSNYPQPPLDIIKDTPKWEVEKIIKARTFGC
jgi:hypothetical protein